MKTIDELLRRDEIKSDAFIEVSQRISAAIHEADAALLAARIFVRETRTGIKRHPIKDIIEQNAAAVGNLADALSVLMRLYKKPISIEK